MNLFQGKYISAKSLGDIRIVQHMAKFTSRVVFLRVQFKKLAKTRVPHWSEQIACVGPVHASLRVSQL